jgi:glycosyltransferase involved in cell wall biosynthesis
VSYGSAPPSGTWKDLALSKIAGTYDESFVHFTGTLSYSSYIQLLKLSSCHVYLTYPFVLSWSLLEAMSTACPIVGSSTKPVAEVITHGFNGLLIDFYNVTGLAESVSQILDDPELASELGKNARQTILNKYSIEHCIQQQCSLVNLVATGALSALNN